MTERDSPRGLPELQAEGAPKPLCAEVAGD